MYVPPEHDQKWSKYIVPFNNNHIYYNGIGCDDGQFNPSEYESDILL
jgi:hypothetical protein